MITSRQRPRTRNILLLGLLISVLIHVLGGSLWPFAKHRLDAIMTRLQPLEPERVATSDIVRLEKRVVPRPQVRRTVQPPRPRPMHQAAPTVPTLREPRVLRETPQQAEPKPDLAHIALHAPLHVALSTGGSSSAERAQTQVPSHERTHYSPEQIDQLDRQFSKTIADSRADLSTVQAQTKSAPATMKHYAISFNGIHAGLRAGQGYIYPIAAPQRIGNTVWYYTHYQYMYADGTVEEDDIPWPFQYPVGHDLFAMHVRLIPLQGPPPGYRPNRPLQPILEQYFGGPDPYTAHQSG